MSLLTRLIDWLDRRGAPPPRASAIAASFVWAAIVLAGWSAWGREPAAEFLAELKSRGYYELALAYLDHLDATGSVDPEFALTIDYEQGEVLIQAALGQRTASRKQADLDRAQQEFEKFVGEHADHPLAFSAKGRLAEILVERARLLTSQADAASTAPQRAEELRGEARRLFAQTAEAFQDQLQQLRTRLEKIPKGLSPQNDAALIKERDLLRAQYVQAQFVSAMVRYEEALTYPEESSERTRLLEQAEQAFKTVAEKYRLRLAGLTAVLFEGRCRQQRRDLRGALSFFEDLLNNLPTNDSALRPLRTKALCGAMQCWLDPEIGQYEAASQHGQAWLKEQRPSERGEDDWLMVQVLLAETYHHLATSGAAGRDKGEMTREARRLAIEVAKYRSDAQPRAQALLAQLGHVTQPVAQTAPMESFDAALAAARDALSQRQVAAQTIALLEQRRSQPADESNRAEIEARLAETQEQLQEAESRALELLRQAQDLVTEETPTDEVNQARYYLAALYYYRGDYHAAAVLADFLSSRFPASEEGRRAAAVSLASLVQLYGDGSSRWAEPLRERMTQTAMRIAKQWKGEPEADDALATLVTLAVQQQDPSSAQQWLDQMSPDSTKRGAAELAVGQALWNRASEGVPADGDANTPAQLQQQAVALLTQGLQRTTGQPPTPTTLAAALLVAQHYLNNDQASQAIKLLEDPGQGPKTLADQGHPLLQSPELRQRVYLLSIMAYLGALSSGDSADELIDKALATLAQMQSSGDQDDTRQQSLSSAYVVLARNLKQQLDDAPAGRRAVLVKAFAQLLERAASTTREWSVLSWVAESFVELGKALRDGDARQAATAQQYFGQAVSTYEGLLGRSDAREFTMTVQDRLLLETRLAIALGEQGEFSRAVDRFAAILQRQPNQVYIQMEAARCLQRWGDGGERDAYMKAILGDRPDTKTSANTIWGYGRLAKLTASKPAFSELFYEARYGVAECRFQYALQLPAADRLQTLKQAEQDILMTARFYPELGGEQQKAKYDRLLQQIQQTMGKRPTGLPS